MKKKCTYVLQPNFLLADSRFTPSRTIQNPRRLRQDISRDEKKGIKAYFQPDQLLFSYFVLRSMNLFRTSCDFPCQQKHYHVLAQHARG